MSSFTVGSLFAGIGGFDLGLERAGMEVRWQVENDKFCNEVLKKNFPKVKRYGDIREVGAHNLEGVDLICGGFPCQPFSVAGKQKGKEDDRYLWPEMLRVIQEVRPHWVVGENVAGLVNLGLDDCISDLEGSGYELQTFIIPACAINAPHRRDRVWIVAWNSNGGVGDERQVEKMEKRKDPKPTRVCRDVANTKGRGTRRVRDKSKAKGPRQSDVLSGKCGRISAKENVPDTEGGRGGCGDVWGDGELRDVARLEGDRTNNGRRTQANESGQWWTVEPDVGRVAHGIPDRTHRLKALGNAVVPQVVEVIGRAIMEAEKETKP